MNRLLVLPLALAATTLLSADAEAVGGAPLDLTVSQLLPGQQARFTVTGLLPGQQVSVLYSTTGEGPGPCNPGGVCADILGPVTVAATATANRDGWASTTVRVPNGVRIGTRVWFQAAVFLGAGGAQSITSDVEAAVVDGLMCPMIFDPVCGIDGNTYSNACEEGVQGWPVDYVGYC